MSENNEPEDDDKNSNPYDAIDENDNLEDVNRNHDQPSSDTKIMELQQLLFKANSEMLTLQSEHSSLLRKHAKLEDEIMELKNRS